MHWVVWGTRTPKDRDEFKRQEVLESILKLLHRAAALARMR